MNIYVGSDSFVSHLASSRQPVGNILAPDRVFGYNPFGGLTVTAELIKLTVIWITSPN